MRFDGSLVWVQLDRALATADWILKFPSIRLHHLQARKRKELLKAKSDSMAGWGGQARIKALTKEIHKLMEKEECLENEQGN